MVSRGVDVKEESRGRGKMKMGTAHLRAIVTTLICSVWAGAINMLLTLTSFGTDVYRTCNALTWWTIESSHASTESTRLSPSWLGVENEGE